jgi:hypothetical protein
MCWDRLAAARQLEVIVRFVEAFCACTLSGLAIRFNDDEAHTHMPKKDVIPKQKKWFFG